MESAAGIADSTPITAITSMRKGPWQHMISAGGDRGFGALFPEEAAAILHAIEHGASVDFAGEREVARFGENHGSLSSHLAQVRLVIAADVAALKKAGPFALPQPVNGRAANVSPLGAVTKRGSTKVRVIHDLSFPRGGDSINAGVADVYLPLSSFGHAARAVRALGPGCLLIKLDVEAAYKQVPVRPRRRTGICWVSCSRANSTTSARCHSGCAPRAACGTCLRQRSISSASTR